MPAATSTSLPVPSASSTLTGRIEASGATPASASPLPSDLRDRACDVRAVAVVVGRRSRCPSMTFQPGSMRPARSGAGATPVSTTATTTPAPRVTTRRPRSRPRRGPIAGRGRDRAGESRARAGAAAARRSGRRATGAGRAAPHSGGSPAGARRRRAASGPLPPARRRMRSARSPTTAPGRRPTTIVSAPCAALGASSASGIARTAPRWRSVSESVHGGSVGEVCVTAQARGVPDV